MKKFREAIKTHKIIMKSWLVIVALILALSPSLVFASTRYEYYNTGDDSSAGVYWHYQIAQTFSPSIVHRITSVKLLLQRLQAGTPGTVTVEIRTTNTGTPTDTVIASGTTDGNTIPVEDSGEWRTFTLGDGAILEAGTLYAIVFLNTHSLGSGDQINWRWDSTVGTRYSNGKYFQNWVGGDPSWTESAKDAMFEEWGDPIANTPVYFPFTNVVIPVVFVGLIIILMLAQVQTEGINIKSIVILAVLIMLGIYLLSGL